TTVPSPMMRGDASLSWNSNLRAVPTGSGSLVRMKMPPWLMSAAYRSTNCSRVSLLNLILSVTGARVACRVGLAKEVSPDWCGGRGNLEPSGRRSRVSSYEDDHAECNALRSGAEGRALVRRCAAGGPARRRPTCHHTASVILGRGRQPADHRLAEEGDLVSLPRRAS